MYSRSAGPTNMARPSLPLGTAGRVRTYRTTDGWSARALFRDYDGTTRQMERVGRSEAGARNALAEAVRIEAGLGPLVDS
jgi:hypothetical protein